MNWEESCFFERVSVLLILFFPKIFAGSYQWSHRDIEFSLWENIWFNILAIETFIFSPSLNFKLWFFKGFVNLLWKKILDMILIIVFPFSFFKVCWSYSDTFSFLLLASHVCMHIYMCVFLFLPWLVFIFLTILWNFSNN